MIQFVFAYKFVTTDSLKLLDFCGLYSGTSLTLPRGLPVILRTRHQGIFNSQNDKRTCFCKSFMQNIVKKILKPEKRKRRKKKTKQTINFTLFVYKIKFCQYVQQNMFFTSKSCSLAIKVYSVDEADE